MSTINLVNDRIHLSREESSLFRSTKKFENKYRWVSKIKDKINQQLEMGMRQRRRQPLNPLNVKMVDYDSIKIQKDQLVSFPVQIRKGNDVINIQDLQTQDKQQLDHINLGEIIHELSLLQYHTRKFQTQQRQKQFFYRQQNFRKFMTEFLKHPDTLQNEEMKIVMSSLHLPFEHLLTLKVQERVQVIDQLFKRLKLSKTDQQQDMIKTAMTKYIDHYIEKQFLNFRKFLQEKQIQFPLMKMIKVFKWVYADFPFPTLLHHRLQIVEFLHLQPSSLNIRLDPYYPGKLLVKYISSSSLPEVKIFRILEKESSHPTSSSIPNVMLQQQIHEKHAKHQGPIFGTMVTFTQIVQR
jgi:hypothetical protein